MLTHKRTLALLWPLIALAGCANVTGGGRAGQPDRWRTIVSANGATAPTETGPSNAKVTAELGNPEPRDDASGRISGRVVGEDGRPVPSASVRLADGSVRSGRDIRDVTDPAGGFTLKGLRTGEQYTLIAERDNGTTFLVGRASAEAPQSSVRIRLRDPETAEADPEVESNRPTTKSRVGRASSRESVEDEGSADPFLKEEESPPPAPRASRAARINTSDLPPAEEAEILDLPETRTAASGPRPIWQPGTATSDPDVATVNTSSPERSVETKPIETRAADPEPASPPPADPRLVVEEEEPNPLPPAKERPIEPLPTPPPAEPKPEPQPAPAPPANDPPPVDAVPAEPLNQPAPDPNSASVPADASPAVDPAPAPPATPEAKPGDPVGIAAQTAPRRKPTWGDLISQSAPAPSVTQVASTIPISTRRLPIRQASNPAPRSSRVFGLLSGKGREETPRDSGLQIAESSVRYDSKRQTLVDFRLPDLSGNAVNLRDFDADYVLLDFWGTWCKPCRESIPKLVELQTRYGPKTLRIVGIASEAAGTSPDSQIRSVDEVARSLGINYPLLMSSLDGKPCPLQEALHVGAYPTMILLDRNGQILWRGTGAETTTLVKLDRVIAARADSGVVRR